MIPALVAVALAAATPSQDPGFVLVAHAGRARRNVERAIVRAGRGAVRWIPDAGSGNSDHREFALAGLPAAKLGVPDEPCRHTACARPSRLQPGAFVRVRRLVARLLIQPSRSAAGSGHDR